MEGLLANKLGEEKGRGGILTADHQKKKKTTFLQTSLSSLVGVGVGNRVVSGHLSPFSFGANCSSHII